MHGKMKRIGILRIYHVVQQRKNIFKESLDVIVRSAKFRTFVKLRKTKQFSESMGIVVIQRQQENT